MLIPKLLAETRLRLARRGFDIKVWCPADMRRIFGITRSAIAYYEKIGVISHPLTRDEKGYIAATPGEVFTMLVELEIHVRERLEKYWELGYHPRKRWRPSFKLIRQLTENGWIHTNN